MPLKLNRACGQVVVGCGVALVALAPISSCASRRQAAAPSDIVKPGGLLSRPRLVASAAEKYPDPTTEQLDFFDELERRELVSQDDALHTVLLVGSHRSAPTYVQRVALAKSHGWLNQGFNRPPREAVTIGEVALLLHRAIGGHNVQVRSQSEALAEMKALGVFPHESRPLEGLTGAQLLAVASMAGGIMTAHPEARADVGIEFADPSAVVVPAAAQPESPPARPTEASPIARSEPLPDLKSQPAPPVVREEPRPEPTPPPPPPPAPAPPPEAAPPATPTPPAEPKKPQWTGGKPLEKKKKKP